MGLQTHSQSVQKGTSKWLWVTLAAIFAFAILGWRVNEGWRVQLLSEGLLSACYQGDTDTALVFLQGGADVNFQFEDGTTPVAAGASNGHADLVRTLRRAGADPSIRDHDGKSPHDRAQGEDTKAALLERER